MMREPKKPANLPTIHNKRERSNLDKAIKDYIRDKQNRDQDIVLDDDQDFYEGMKDGDDYNSCKP